MNAHHKGEKNMNIVKFPAFYLENSNTCVALKQFYLLTPFFMRIGSYNYKNLVTIAKV